MEIYLLRHGESTANKIKLVCGCLDYPLSTKGIKQAEKICNHLNNIRFTHIYCSSLSRAIQTIKHLKTSIKLEIESEIKELNTGSVSTITLPELWEKDNRFKQPWLFSDLKYPDGESFNEMFTRISTWFEKNIVTWKEDDVILIVGHEGTLRTIYSKIMNLEIQSYPDFSINNCDYLYFKTIDHVTLDYKHTQLETLNGDTI